MRLCKLFLTALALAVAAMRTPLVQAHHSFSSEYDRAKPVSLTGAVTTIEWTNPHAWIHIEVPGPRGPVTWQIELGGPSMLSRQGWGRTTVKRGDTITVAGYAAKGSQPRANAITVTLPGGFRIESGASGATQSR